MYFLLIRIISPYTGPDILLGVFDSEQAAQDARNSYLDQYRSTEQKPTTNGWFAQIFPWLRRESDTNSNGDPWHRQAYKPDGLTKDDLVILTFDLENDPTFNEISVVSCYLDYMGQISREIDSIHPNQLVAEHRMKQIETIAENTTATDHMPPNRFDTQTVRINKIQSDAPEHQTFR